MRLAIQETNMPTPIETVTAFFHAFHQDHGRTAIRRWFTPETVYVNEGVSITTGADEAIANIERSEKTSAVATVGIDMLAIAADGNRVLTERQDRFERADGSEITSAKVMGILEVEGDRIVAWRDYFDVGLVQKIANG
jgi:limonene-1,2-epoxide hydrolase